MKDSWTKSAIECYLLSGNCDKCSTRRIIESSECHMYATVKNLLKNLGKPPGIIKPLFNESDKKENKIMFDKDLNIEYPDKFKIFVEVLKQGHEKTSIISTKTGIKMGSILFYFNNFFKVLLEQKLVNPNNDKTNKQAVIDFIKSRLIDQDYTESCSTKYMPVKQEVKKDEKLNTSHQTPIVSEKLTEQETKVKNLLLEGLSYKAVAEKLFIAVTTVKAHVTAIFQKENYHSLQELIVSEFKKENDSLKAKLKENENKQFRPDFDNIKEKLKEEINRLQDKLRRIEEAEEVLKTIIAEN